MSLMTPVIGAPAPPTRVSVRERIETKLSSNVVRMAPVLLTFVVVVSLAVLAPGFAVGHSGAIVAACAVMGLATLASITFSIRPGLPFEQSVPVLAILAAGVLRAGVGDLATVIMILPMLWLAVLPGRRWLVVAVLALTAAFSLYFAFPVEREHAGADLAAIVVVPLIFALVNYVVHRIAAQERKRHEQNVMLVEQREEALNDAVDLVRQVRENEGQLESTNRLFRSVLDSVTRQSVIGTDLSGSIDVWNTGAEILLGVTAEDAIGKHFVHEFHVAEELESRARELGYPAGATVLNPGFSALVEVARLGGSEDREWTYVRKGGDTLQVHVAVTPRVDRDGRSIGYIFVGSDITEVKELAKLQDEFVGLVSHELRTPISSVLGYLELMRDETEAPLSEEQLHYLSVAERNAHRLLRLVGDLLFTAQVAAHKFPIETVETDLNIIVGNAIESARPSSQAANVLLLSKPCAGAPIVLGDATRIAQACDNLLSNAIKFTPRGGTVTVSTSVDGSEVTVSVRDTGMGIPPDEIAMLSTRFFRASTATRSAVQGVGLGLSITKAIVNAHGGSLGAESQVGEGTTFSFTIPLLRVEGLETAQ